jgi:hypothetical protein
MLQILCSVDPKLLKLTPHDEYIYKSFREEFPDFFVDKLDEDHLKSPEAKEVFFFRYSVILLSVFKRLQYYTVLELVVLILYLKRGRIFIRVIWMYFTVPVPTKITSLQILVLKLKFILLYFLMSELFR